MQQAQTIFSTTIWPQLCVMCKCNADLAMDLCTICYQELPWLQNSCYQCGEQLQLGKESIRCEQCIFAPPPFTRFCGLFGYQTPVVRWVRQLKFSFNLAYGNLLGQLLQQQVTSWYKGTDLPQAIIPMPLHTWRLRRRGFNQAHELLRPISKTTSITILDDVCMRKKYTKPQTTGGIRHRQRNLRGAFTVTKRIPYQHIAIVDDVFTTGSTMRAVSTVLAKAGVTEIDIWCICRA